MPYYTVIVKERGKSHTLPDKIFAPCASDAWKEAEQNLPKGTKILDVVPEQKLKKWSIEND